MDPKEVKGRKQWATSTMEIIARDFLHHELISYYMTSLDYGRNLELKMLWGYLFGNTENFQKNVNNINVLITFFTSTPTNLNLKSIVYRMFQRTCLTQISRLFLRTGGSLGAGS